MAPPLPTHPWPHKGRERIYIGDQALLNVSVDAGSDKVPDKYVLEE